MLLFFRSSYRTVALNTNYRKKAFQTQTSTSVDEIMEEHNYLTNYGEILASVAVCFPCLPFADVVGSLASP